MSEGNSNLEEQKQNDKLDLDDSYLVYLKNQFNIIPNMNVDGKVSIATTICSYYYNAFKPRFTENEPQLKSVKWQDKQTWPKYLTQDRPTIAQLEGLELVDFFGSVPPHNASTLAWLLYLLYYPEIVKSDSSPVDELTSFAIKNTNETPMDWKWMVEEAVKDNDMDPLDDPDFDSQVIKNSNDDDIIELIPSENIDNNTDLQIDNTNDESGDIISFSDSTFNNVEE